MSDLLSPPELVHDAAVAPHDSLKLPLAGGLDAREVDDDAVQNARFGARGLRDELLLPHVEVVGARPRLFLRDLARRGGEGEGGLA